MEIGRRASLFLLLLFLFGGWFVFACVVKYTILTILSVKISDIKRIHIVVLGWILRATYQVLQMLLFKITFCLSEYECFGERMI